jgi:hypothetical protein
LVHADAELVAGCGYPCGFEQVVIYCFPDVLEVVENVDVLPATAPLEERAFEYVEAVHGNLLASLGGL